MSITWGALNHTSFLITIMDVGNVSATVSVSLLHPGPEHACTSSPFWPPLLCKGPRRFLSLADGLWVGRRFPAGWAPPTPPGMSGSAHWAAWAVTAQSNGGFLLPSGGWDLSVQENFDSTPNKQELMRYYLLFSLYIYSFSLSPVKLIIFPFICQHYCDMWTSLHNLIQLFPLFCALQHMCLACVDYWTRLLYILCL